MSNQTTNQKKTVPCLIWPTNLVLPNRVLGSGRGQQYELDSPRAGGKYIVPFSFLHNDNIKSQQGFFDLDEKLVLSAWIARENLRGNIPDLASMIGDNRESAEDYFMKRLPSVPKPRERAYLLLEGLVKKALI